MVGREPRISTPEISLDLSGIIANLNANEINELSNNDRSISSTDFNPITPPPNTAREIDR